MNVKQVEQNVLSDLWFCYNGYCYSYSSKTRFKT